jgi:hypothetical protein
MERTVLYVAVTANGISLSFRNDPPPAAKPKDIVTTMPNRKSH